MGQQKPIHTQEQLQRRENQQLMEVPALIQALRVSDQESDELGRSERQRVRAMLDAMWAVLLTTPAAVKHMLSMEQYMVQAEFYMEDAVDRGPRTRLPQSFLV